MYEAGHVCGDMVDMINDKPTGSVRISFGYMSCQADVDTLIQLIREGFEIDFYENGRKMENEKYLFFLFFSILSPITQGQFPGDGAR